MVEKNNKSNDSNIMLFAEYLVNRATPLAFDWGHLHSQIVCTNMNGADQCIHCVKAPAYYYSWAMLKLLTSVHIGKIIFFLTKTARATIFLTIFLWRKRRFYPNLMILQVKFGFFI